jgi:plastocyanin
VHDVLSYRGRRRRSRTAGLSEEVHMNLHRTFPALVVGLVAVVALAGCGKISNSYGQSDSSGGGAAATPMPTMSSGGGAVAPATGNMVAIQNFSFTPQTLTVKAGDTVTWTNNDSAVHNVTSTDGPGTGAATTGLFSSGSMNAGQSYSYTFAKAGTYYYECTIHAAMATMHATVVVK